MCLYSDLLSHIDAGFHYWMVMVKKYIYKNNKIQKNIKIE